MMTKTPSLTLNFTAFSNFQFVVLNILYSVKEPQLIAGFQLSKQNGTYTVHSLALLKDVDNTGHVELPRWINSALLSLKGDDLLFRIVESSQLDR